MKQCPTCLLLLLKLMVPQINTISIIPEQQKPLNLTIHLPRHTYFKHLYLFFDPGTNIRLPLSRHLRYMYSTYQLGSHNVFSKSTLPPFLLFFFYSILTFNYLLKSTAYFTRITTAFQRNTNQDNGCDKGKFIVFLPRGASINIPMF